MARKAKELDLIGDVCGQLTVVSKSTSRTNKSSAGITVTRAYWNCKCSCGNSTEVRQDAITGGTAKSCGCLRLLAAKDNVKKAQASTNKRKPEDLTGIVFGRLTVISPAPRSITPKGRELPRWLCSCKCGGQIDALHDSLKAGTSVSCGCVPPEFVDSEFKNKTEVFAYKASEIHCGKYDYSLTEFVHSQKPLLISCPIHGSFMQKPSNHLLGSGCSKCSGSYTVNKNTFVESVEELICSKHGSYSAGSGCDGCYKEASDIKIKSYIDAVSVLHDNKYDYSLVSFTVKRDKVSIICPLHGEFQLIASDHLSGRGCPTCGKLSTFLSTEEFIERSVAVHGDRFDYSLVDYKHSTYLVDIICKVHGLFSQKANTHLNGHKCPKCSGEDRALKQHWNYIKMCELNPTLAESEGTLYLLEMVHNEETFLKVGISSNLDKRLGRYKEEGISFKIISKIESNALQVAIWEKQVLAGVRSSHFRYIPKVSFKGWTECATNDSREYILDLMEGLTIE